MSHMTNESDDEMPLKDRSDSALTNEGSCRRRLGSLKKGPWTSSEDAILVDYVKKHGEGNWNAVQKHSGLFRCGKSCRLRWSNHLRPNLKKGTFTAEEERLIIELHAKMGNKWARMAARLPGRTDNEIKNYWNTRIKRRQRAGLPLYPTNVSLEALNENPHYQSIAEFSCNRIPQNHNFLKAGNYDIPNIIFGNLKTAQRTFSNSPIFSNISVNSMLSLGIGSSKNYALAHSVLNHKKHIPESETFFPDFLHPVDNFPNCTHEKISWPFGLVSPFDTDPKSKNMAPFNGAMSGSHALFNGNYSTSKFLPRAMKLELPSLQYPESDLSIPPSVEAVDTYLQFPLPSNLNVPVETNCLSPRNSGLLEALLPRATDSTKQQSSEKSSNSSSVVTPNDVIDSSTMSMCDRDWEDYGDSLSPFRCSAVSVLTECPPISGCSLNETSTTTKVLLGSNIKFEADEPVSTLENGGGKKSCSRINFTKPDALLGSNLFEQNSEYARDLSMTDAIAALLGEDFCGNYKHIDFGISSTLSREQGLGSCPWNNMPAVCGFHYMICLHLRTCHPSLMRKDVLHGCTSNFLCGADYVGYS